MTVNCKLCIIHSTCQWVGKTPDCQAFSWNRCGRCRHYTSFEDFGKGTCDGESERVTTYVNDPACEHFKEMR